MGIKNSKMIITGDSLHELKKLPENSVDSIVTDPPYGLSFMGKKWDYDVPTKELWTEAIRVLKPGGYLLAFAGTRTQHRMAVNIEDAGFEIRDMIAYIYGSGFPKSHNIGKAVDKLQGNDRDTSGIVDSKTSDNKDNNTFNASPRFYEETKGTSPHEGWGTALKPALEPITVARKPFKGTVAQNVLKWGTGGINIDGSRVATTDNTAGVTSMTALGQNSGWNSHENKQVIAGGHAQGRFPANLIHDGSDEVVGLMGEPARFFYTAKASKSERNKGLEGFEAKIATQRMNASTDRYEEGREPTPRAEQSKSQNTHPTVKPVKLMQYLVKLVTPVGGTCLDPFNGSGTTGIACKLEGMEYIGIELDPEYVKISEARIEVWEPEVIQEQAILL